MKMEKILKSFNNEKKNTSNHILVDEHQLMKNTKFCFMKFPVYDIKLNIGKVSHWLSHLNNLQLQNYILLYGLYGMVVIFKIKFIYFSR